MFAKTNLNFIDMPKNTSDKGLLPKPNNGGEIITPKPNKPKIDPKTGKQILND